MGLPSALFLSDSELFSRLEPEKSPQGGLSGDPHARLKLEMVRKLLRLAHGKECRFEVFRGGEED